MNEPQPNRAVFTEIAYRCSCCNETNVQNKFIANGCSDGRVLVTFECRNCFKLVQVFVAGESFVNGGNYAKAL